MVLSFGQRLTQWHLWNRKIYPDLKVKAVRKLLCRLRN